MPVLPMSESTFSADLVKALGAIPAMAKDAQNPFFKSQYLTLDKIIATIRPILAANNLVVMQNILAVEGGMACQTVIRHSSGESISSDLLIFPCAVTDPQKIAGLITYLKRYQLGAFLLISTDQDDDANQVAAEVTAPKTKKAAAAPVTGNPF
jgi:hypothetical protein